MEEMGERRKVNKIYFYHVLIEVRQSLGQPFIAFEYFKIVYLLVTD